MAGVSAHGRGVCQWQGCVPLAGVCTRGKVMCPMEGVTANGRGVCPWHG